MVYPVENLSMKDISRIYKVASSNGFPMNLSCGSSIVSVLSPLGMAAFVGRDVFLVAPDGTNPCLFNKLIKRMGY